MGLTYQPYQVFPKCAMSFGLSMQSMCLSPGLLNNSALHTWQTTTHLWDSTASLLRNHLQLVGSFTGSCLCASIAIDSSHSTLSTAVQTQATEQGSGSHWISLFVYIHVLFPPHNRVSQRQKPSFIFVSRCHEGGLT